MTRIIFFVLLSLSLWGEENSPFGPRQDLGEINYEFLKEISGMASSRINDDIFWIHNDSGNENKIFAIDRTGKLKAIYVLDDIELIDTEDIAVGVGPDEDVPYIYLADIGDNNAARDVKYIYRFREPEIPLSSTVITDTIKNIDLMTFDYPDGKRDAETIMIDPIDKNIIIVSKREKNVNVYSAPIPAEGDSQLTFEKIAVLPFGSSIINNSGVTAGDISAEGNEILIKTYLKIYYYSRTADESLEKVFQKTPLEVAYEPEPQGEAICFGSKGEGFYTTSEASPLNITPRLYFYPKLTDGIDEGYNFNPRNIDENSDLTKFEIYNLKGLKLSDVYSINQLETGLYFLKDTNFDKLVFKKLFIIK
jgi:hypothetical protein